MNCNSRPPAWSKTNLRGRNMRDYAADAVKELDKVQTTADFCTEWKTKWRALAVTAQAILQVLFPPGAKVLGFLIEIADNFCSRSVKQG